MTEIGPFGPSRQKIAEKLVKLAHACATIKKGGTNEFHKYRYVEDEAVMAKINEECNKLNLASLASFKIIETQAKKNSRGGDETLVLVESALTIIDADSGEYVVSGGVGGGQDSGDKGAMKACTAAHKYAWLKTLNISTEDPEADADLDRRMTASPQTVPPSQRPTDVVITPGGLVTRSATPEEKAWLSPPEGPKPPSGNVTCLCDDGKGGKLPATWWKKKSIYICGKPYGSDDRCSFRSDKS